jgi:amidase
MTPPGPWTPSRPQPFADAITREPGPLRVGVCVAPPAGGVAEESAAAAEATAQLLESLGHGVETVVPDWSALRAAAPLPMSAPGPAALVDVEHAEALEPRNVSMLRRLATMTLLEHARLVEEARSATRRFVTLWDDIDVLVTPASGLLPPPVEWATWDMAPDVHRAQLVDFPMFAWPFNVTGQPALTVPATVSRDGLPIGVQLVGRHLDEATLLAVAAQLETAAPWSDRLRRVAAAL